MFQPLGNNGIVWKAIELRVNLYTGPGFLIALLSVINGVLLVVLFKEFNVQGTKRKISLKELCIKKKENCGSKIHRSGRDGEFNYVLHEISLVIVLVYRRLAINYCRDISYISGLACLHARVYQHKEK